MEIPNVKLQYLDENRNRFIGKQIARARKMKKFKACELADAIGIGKDQYSKIENGKVTCTIDNLFLLSQYLDLDVHVLLFGEERDFRRNSLDAILDTLDEEQITRAEVMIKAAFGSLSN